MKWHGIPVFKEFAITISLMTTAFAPTIDPFAIFTPFKIATPLPIQISSPNTIEAALIGCSLMKPAPKLAE